MSRHRLNPPKPLAVPRTHARTKAHSKARIDEMVHLRIEHGKSTFIDTKTHRLKYPEADTFWALRELRKKIFQANGKFKMSRDEEKFWAKYAD